MADTDRDDRTEPATAKRRREAREEGQVARSIEVVTAFVLGAALLGLWMGAANAYSELSALTRHVLGLRVQETLSRDAVIALVIRVSGSLVRAVLPVLGAGLIGGLAGNLVQVGFLVSWKAVTPNPDRLNPISGFQNLFQKAKLIDLIKTFLKVIVVAWAAYAAIRGRLEEIPHLTELSPAGLLAYSADISFQILKNCLLAVLVIALFDYFFQRWQYEERLRMTKQEVREEYRETEGDPLIKSRIRNLQREMARRRMMAEVPKADVVITNPTHFAVALRYTPTEMNAPQVVAKGADVLAQKIQEVARENGVPLFQSPAVARTLYRQVDIGDSIPADLFQAVAEILAHVYRLSGRTP
ncbi:MAG: flagellar biosynthesis protein FlhB [Deltaproteobacteria bacterium]|nr:flagellar biosynthesis protein FlhB [Deltaproteobacteria bacterium]